MCPSRPTGILIEDFPSTFTEEDLSKAKALYNLPGSVRLPFKRERADWRVDGWVCMHEVAFEMGLRLPLPPFIKEVLIFYDCAPSRLMPKAWRLLIALQALNDLENLDISVKTLHHTYFPKITNKNEGFVQFNKRSGKQPLVNDCSRGECCSWKNRFIFCRLESVFGPGDPRESPSHWRGLRNLHASKVSTEESGVKRVFDLSWEARSVKALLTVESLGRTSVRLPHVPESKGHSDSFIETFMENSEDRDLSFKEIREQMKRSRTSCSSAMGDVPEVVMTEATGGSPIRTMVAVSPTEISETNMVVPACSGDIFRVDLGKGVHLRLDPKKIHGKMELLSLDEAVQNMGSIDATAYAIPLVVKALSAMVVANQRSNTEKQTLAFAYKGLAEKNEELGVSLREERLKVENMKHEFEKMKGLLENKISELETVKCELKVCQMEKRKIQKKTMIMARRELLMEIVVGEDKNWAPAEEGVKLCDEMLEALEEAVGEREIQQ